VDQYSTVGRIVDQILAWKSITRVEELAVLFTLNEACVRLRTMVHLNRKHSVNAALMLQHIKQLLNVLILRLKLLNSSVNLWEFDRVTKFSMGQ
jgi:hypothetical protein